MNIKPKNTHRYFMSLQVYCRGCSKNPGLDVLSCCTTKMRYRMGYIYGPQLASLAYGAEKMGYKVDLSVRYFYQSVNCNL
jgi:hypothetical protein